MWCRRTDGISFFGGAYDVPIIGLGHSVFCIRNGGGGHCVPGVLWCKKTVHNTGHMVCACALRWS